MGFRPAEPDYKLLGYICDVKIGENNIITCFSLREKLSAEPTDEGLVVIIEHGMVEFNTAIIIPSSPCSAGTFSRTGEGSRTSYQKATDRIPDPRRLAWTFRVFKG